MASISWTYKDKCLQVALYPSRLSDTVTLIRTYVRNVPLALIWFIKSYRFMGVFKVPARKMALALLTNYEKAKKLVHNPLPTNSKSEKQLTISKPPNCATALSTASWTCENGTSAKWNFGFLTESHHWAHDVPVLLREHPLGRVNIDHRLLRLQEQRQACHFREQPFWARPTR